MTTRILFVKTERGWDMAYSGDYTVRELKKRAQQIKDNGWYGDSFSSHYIIAEIAEQAIFLPPTKFKWKT